jgi:hypothetical protein
MDEKKLEALLEQAIVDCYDEEEEFSGVLCTLDDNLNFPLQAEVMGEPVEVIGLDDRRSSPRKASWPGCARATRSTRSACPSW